MQYIKEFIAEHKKLFALIILALLGQVSGTLIIPYFVADMIDEGILVGNMNEVIKNAMFMLSAAIVTAIVAIWGCYLCADAGAKLGRNYREALLRKTQELSKKRIDDLSISSLITRSTLDITNIQQTFIMFLQMILPAPMIAITAVVMTWQVSPTMTLILLACIVLFLISSGYILLHTQHISKRIQVKMDHINQIVRQSIIGMRVIRAFNNTAYEKQRSDNVFQDYATTMISLNKKFALLNPIVWMIMGVSIAAIIYFGGSEVFHGSMAVGAITSVSEYAIMTLSYLIMASFTIVTLPKMHACLLRLQEVLECPIDICDPTLPLPLEEAITSLSFEHVSFAYEHAQLPVLEDISFTCHSKQTTAIIGSTGSGKSTIASLLLRLHDIQSGAIKLNDTDIRDMSQQTLRDAIGYVPQKAFLFSGNIADNLKMGKQTASEQDMQEALTIAQAMPFINELKEGLNAPVAQGGNNFSGGQKQRLSIARALIKNAPILMFDDSFSALDAKTDTALRLALQQERSNAITLIIAQRIATIMDADQILVLDEGRLVGKGTHKELMKTCSVYQEIANSQLGKEVTP